jgi:hypothetical protein
VEAGVFHLGENVIRFNQTYVIMCTLSHTALPTVLMSSLHNDCMVEDVQEPRF